MKKRSSSCLETIPILPLSPLVKTFPRCRQASWAIDLRPYLYSQAVEGLT